MDLTERVLLWSAVGVVALGLAAGIAMTTMPMDDSMSGSMGGPMMVMMGIWMTLPLAIVLLLAWVVVRVLNERKTTGADE